MSAHRIVAVALLLLGAGATGLAACDLNPQPLPPVEDPGGEFTPGGSDTADDAGAFGGGNGDASFPGAAEDAGIDGGDDRTDGGDAGDAGDGGGAGDATAEASVDG